MLSVRLIAIAAAFGLVACHRLTSDERKLIGTWESHSMDTTWRTTFNPDHTCSTVLEVDGRFDNPFPGSWRLEGSQLITKTDFRNLEAPSGEKAAPNILTEKITFVGNDTIESSVNYPYIRVMSGTTHLTRRCRFDRLKALSWPMGSERRPVVR